MEIIDIPYLDGGGLVFWRNETSGALPGAVWKLLSGELPDADATAYSTGFPIQRGLPPKLCSSIGLILPPRAGVLVPKTQTFACNLYLLAWFLLTALRVKMYQLYHAKLATPCIQLVADLRSLGLEELAQRAIAGEFDSTPEESEAWFEREGKNHLPSSIWSAFGNKPKKSKPKGFGGDRP
jgi:hypothetical protein